MKLIRVHLQLSNKYSTAIYSIKVDEPDNDSKLVPYKR